jgi:hypothetical protein
VQFLSRDLLKQAKKRKIINVKKISIKKIYTLAKHFFFFWRSVKASLKGNAILKS